MENNQLRVVELAVSLALLMILCGSAARAGAITEAQTSNSQNKFYCNIHALSAAERAHHKELTEKLLGARKESVETPSGYEFQFNPKTVTLGELADWVGAESKCCSFLDFHIDVEAEGNLLCLRLTGEDGVKAFIRAEFGVKSGV
jgi:hypothetical protein